MQFIFRHTTLSKTFSSLKVQLRKISTVFGVIGILSLVLIGSCTSSGGQEKEDDFLIAKVFNKTLFQSELKELLGENVSTEDSAQIANAYIEKWVRESVLMHEAEKYVPSDLNIDELVRDYRASLIRHNYEKLLVEMNLDSTINSTELNTYYQENKEQYKLKQPIVKCHFIKVPKATEGWDEAKKWWKRDNEEGYRKLVDYCSRHAEIYMLNDSVWYNLNDISQHLPKGKLTANNYQSNKKISTSDDDFEYLLKIFDTTPSGEYAPLAFVLDQATKVILHKRKINLLEKKKEEMYEREEEGNNIKIYVQ